MITSFIDLDKLLHKYSYSPWIGGTTTFWLSLPSAGRPRYIYCSNKSQNCISDEIWNALWSNLNKNMTKSSLVIPWKNVVKCLTKIIESKSVNSFEKLVEALNKPPYKPYIGHNAMINTTFWLSLADNNRYKYIHCGSKDSMMITKEVWETLSEEYDRQCKVILNWRDLLRIAEDNISVRNKLIRLLKV